MNEKPNFFYKIKSNGQVNQLDDEFKLAFTPEDREKRLQEDLLKIVTRLPDNSPGNPVPPLNRGLKNGGHSYHSQPPKRL